ncbi:MAG: [Firmicutes bacterium]|nr:[FeFe] hydrogenase H-cluster maturation GTPase HydF [Bacillota bacterium]
MNRTPKANRLHIGIFGRRNAGKSSLINALTGQNLAIVSDTPGTTADPVYKSMELHPIGPVVFIDTAGFDDEGELGELRVAKTASVISRADLAIVVIDGTDPISNEGDSSKKGTDPTFDCERTWIGRLREANVPTIIAVNKWDILNEEERLKAINTATDFDDTVAIPVSAETGAGIDALRKAIQDALPEEYMQEKLLGDMLEDGSLVLLVMPQDIQAPKGRLILPQVQTIRELLDRKCQVMSTTADGLADALAALSRAPDLIITDSQCFGDVYAQKPEASALTSFSILMAASKGDINVFVEGASAIDKALAGIKTSAADKPADPFRVLIAEACTHVPLNEDIGTVKIPRLLHETFGDSVTITSVRGNDFPAADELTQYDLIIHCGACMFNRRHVMNRIAAAQKAGVPITNYGIFLAKMAGILDKVSF